MCDVTLQRLERAGFDRTSAAEALRAVWAYAIGQGLIEISILLPAAFSQAGDAATPLERLRQVLCRIPSDVPPRLAEVACVVCDCDLDRQFAQGLELIIAGLEPRIARARGGADA